MTERERFEALCKKDAYTLRSNLREGIGTYKEKRLHRILKEYISGDADKYEIAVGSYVADIFEDGHIYEIQTGNFARLLPKLAYYLNETDLSVTVVCPIIRNKRLYRIDGESGEILRKRLSSAHGALWDALPPLYSLRSLLPNDRLDIRVLLIDAEEYRYSEKMHYRREGSYECELFPVSLEGEYVLSSLSDFAAFLPEGLESFTAAEYSALVKRRGRDLYSALNLFVSLGLLERKRDGRRYIYGRR